MFKQFRNTVNWTMILTVNALYDYTCRTYWSYMSNIECAVHTLTLSDIHKFCSRRPWKQLGKNRKKLYKCRYNYWKELKTLRQKKKLLVLSNFYFCHNVVQSRRLHIRQKVSVCEKGFKSKETRQISLPVYTQYHFPDIPAPLHIDRTCFLWHSLYSLSCYITE